TGVSGQLPDTLLRSERMPVRRRGSAARLSRLYRALQPLAVAGGHAVPRPLRRDLPDRSEARGEEQGAAAPRRPALADGASRRLGLLQRGPAREPGLPEPGRWSR